MHQIRTLSNGIRVVSEAIPYVKSVSIGVWVGNGSRHETLEESGVSHYIEHMLFKGTQRREAWQIAREIDAVGGQINAFTSREYTCYYTKTLDAHAPLAVDILSDMLFHSKLDASDMELERQVILEEINMYEDDPEELVHDLIMEAAYGDNPLGRSILGTKERLSAMDSAFMRRYMETHYTARDMVIAVSGNFDEGLFALLEQAFGQQALQENLPAVEPAIRQTRRVVRTKDTEQVQLVLGYEGIDVLDEGVYSLMAFNNIFGNGMSSRLFQNIREKLGLAYSVYAYHASYIGAGMFNISAGMSLENFEKVADLIFQEVDLARREKLTAEEVAVAKEQLKGNYILSNESPGARMQAAGRSLLLNRPIYSQEEILMRIEAVSVDSVAEIIDRILRPETLCAAVVGAVEEIGF
ncbi:MAG TPA: insulinase family protein [Candidatus Avimonoglobus intestinipullorum]|uniref:Insulinase family protein n=1 Tax=Candidatus Avimonoglobus intestinipullorum TaxID=2840699 RepID=A0A9D1LVN7_9FIRM|nr:insulinase family protein [Candidatus Avimonoglobus intestinipullorum]